MATILTINGSIGQNVGSNEPNQLVGWDETQLDYTMTTNDRIGRIDFNEAGIYKITYNNTSEKLLRSVLLMDPSVNTYSGNSSRTTFYPKYSTTEIYYVVHNQPTYKYDSLVLFYTPTSDVPEIGDTIVIEKVSSNPYNTNEIYRSTPKYGVNIHDEAQLVSEVVGVGMATRWFPMGATVRNTLGWDVTPFEENTTEENQMRFTIPKTSTYTINMSGVVRVNSTSSLREGITELQLNGSTLVKHTHLGTVNDMSWTHTYDLNAGDEIAVFLGSENYNYNMFVDGGMTVSIQDLNAENPQYEPRGLTIDSTKTASGSFDINQDNPTFDPDYYSISNDGKITFLQNGVYEVTEQMTTGSITNFTKNNELGSFQNEQQFENFTTNTYKYYVNGSGRTLDYNFDYTEGTSYSLRIDQVNSNIIDDLQDEYGEIMGAGSTYVIPNYCDPNNHAYIFTLEETPTLIRRTNNLFTVGTFSGFTNVTVKTKQKYETSYMRIRKNGTTIFDVYGNIDTKHSEPVTPGSVLEFTYTKAMSDEMTLSGWVLKYEQGLQQFYNIFPINNTTIKDKAGISIQEVSQNPNYDVAGNIITINTTGYYNIISDFYIPNFPLHVQFKYTHNSHTVLLGRDELVEIASVNRNFLLKAGATIEVTLNQPAPSKQTYVRAGIELVYKESESSYIANKKVGRNYASLEPVDNVLYTDMTLYQTRAVNGYTTTGSGGGITVPQDGETLYRPTLHGTISSLENLGEVTVNIIGNSTILETRKYNINGNSAVLDFSAIHLPNANVTYRFEISDPRVEINSLIFYTDEVDIPVEYDKYCILQLTSDNPTTVGYNNNISWTTSADVCYNRFVKGGGLKATYDGQYLKFGETGRYRVTELQYMGYTTSNPGDYTNTVFNSVLTPDRQHSTMYYNAERTDDNAYNLNYPKVQKHTNIFNIDVTNTGNWYAGGIVRTSSAGSHGARLLDGSYILVEKISNEVGLGLPLVDVPGSIFTLQAPGLGAQESFNNLHGWRTENDKYGFLSSSKDIIFPFNGRYRLEFNFTRRSTQYASYSAPYHRVYLDSTSILTDLNVNLNKSITLDVTAGQRLSWKYDQYISQALTDTSYVAVIPINVQYSAPVPDNKKRVKVEPKMVAWEVRKCSFNKEPWNDTDVQYEIDFTKEVEFVLLHEEISSSSTTREKLSDSFSVEINYNERYETMITDLKMYEFVRVINFTDGTSFRYPYVADNFTRTFKEGMWYLQIEGRMKPYISDGIVNTNLNFGEQIIPKPLPQGFEFDDTKLQTNLQNDNKYVYPTNWNSYDTTGKNHQEVIREIIRNNYIKGFKIGNGRLGTYSDEHEYSSWRIMANLDAVDVEALSSNTGVNTIMQPNLTFGEFLEQYDQEFKSNTVMDFNNTLSGKNKLIIRPANNVDIDLRPYFQDMVEFKHNIDYTKQGIIHLRGEGYIALNASREKAYNEYMLKIPRPFEIIEDEDKEWLASDDDKMRRYAYSLNRKNGIKPELDFKFSENVCFDLDVINPGDMLYFNYFNIKVTVEVESITESITEEGVQFDYVFKGVYV